MSPAHYEDPSPAYTPSPTAAVLGWIPNPRRLPTLPRHYTSSSMDSTSSARSSNEVEKVIHTYALTAGSADLQFSITIEPGPDHLGHHILFLTMKTGSVERPICMPVPLKLKVDPRDVRFSVFMFPTKASLPEGCLHSLRVWLRANEVDHRLFSEDSLWVGRDPDFYSIKDATFARLRSTTQDAQVYRAVIGRALIDLIIR
ncbi:hypothetical protein EW146_g6013 [Bondarzewia mesenterica]|uniref:Uncharacterized protein n=1 Tax=Bondarzewia mesenterica TaxID=1095465 RepID=A0A4S4LPT7_9AGAM|nr:hypothetical protein EW146_g6013 [Bondarzewia mesenterica]